MGLGPHEWGRTERNPEWEFLNATYPYRLEKWRADGLSDQDASYCGRSTLGATLYKELFTHAHSSSQTLVQP